MRTWVVGALSIVAVVATARRCGGPSPSEPVRVVTFNIRDFPESAGQVRGAFALLARIAPEIVAVQEITDGAALARATSEHLGRSWRAVIDDVNRTHHVGLLVDERRVKVDWARARKETMIDGAGKAVLEVRLTRSGRGLRVFVVHLKAGGSDEESRLRARQLEALAGLVRAARADGDGDEILVLGDFNSTIDADRASLTRFARAAALRWDTERLRCTSYWNRSDGCRGTALDHLFSSIEKPARDVAARGPCETVGCDPGDRCPAFHREVSDHCPVSAALD